MRSSLFWRTVILYTTLLVITVGGTRVLFRSITENKLVNFWKANLEAQAQLFAPRLEEQINTGAPKETLDYLIQKTALQLDLRVSVFLNNQTTPFDSDPSFPDIQYLGLEPEIQQALAGTISTRERRGESLAEDALLVAVPLFDHSRIIGALRLSVPLTRIREEATLLMRNVLLFTALAVFMAGLLGVVLTYQWTQPIQIMTKKILSLGAGQIVSAATPTRLNEIDQLERAVDQMILHHKSQIETFGLERTTFRAVLNHMTDGMLIVDEQGIVKMINPAAELMFAISETEAVNKSLAEVVRHHQLVDLWKECLRSGSQQNTTMETNPARLSLDGIATTLGESLPGSILLVIRDLTRLRKLEMVRRDFVSNVSHELRTPLASLKALAETLNEGALEDPPAARRFLMRMDGEIDNLTQIVQELLELSRIESGRVPLERILTRPGDLVRSAVERMQLQTERAALELRTEFQPALPSINVDPQRLGQVLINLLHNAIKFTPPGGVIKLSAYQDSNRIVFSVNDNGVGIAPDSLERIFERFYKADRARSGGGTGLGLSIARHLVEAHDGQIWAESEPGKGSTFFFSIPM